MSYNLMHSGGPQMQAARENQMEEAVKPLSDIPAINRFLSYCRIRTVPSKTVVIHAGDLPDVLYYIISGSVEVMVEDEEGNEMVLAYLNKGQFFGEMGLFHESPLRSAWVRTRNHCELAEMTYPRFRQIAAESPGLVFELATQLATRLDRTNRKLSDLAFVDVTGRVAHAIMDLCGEPDAMTHPEGMQIKVSRQELSRLVGCSREMAGRVLKVLEDQGLLRATGKTIVVFNARPKMKTRPVVVPVQGGKGGSGAVRNTRVEDDDDEDEDDDEQWGHSSFPSKRGRTSTKRRLMPAFSFAHGIARGEGDPRYFAGHQTHRSHEGMNPCAR
jgi:CRP/FNR family transcriptional regulator, cyclic AMP receptor protein